MEGKTIMNKHLISCILTAVCIIPCLVGCGSTSGSAAETGSESLADSTSGKTAEFSYWLGQGYDAFYTDYSNNPVFRYLTKFKKWGVNKDTTVKINFQIPPFGSQSDNLNTMIGSGDYTDIIDATYYSGSIRDLYDEGVILDLTDYVTKYMPHYTAWLDAHPDYKKMSTIKVNGETKYIKLCDVNDTCEPWGGFCYRRDWLVKYGTNPTTGAAFTGGYANAAKTEWTDDVVFPSKENYPKTLGDWEWMLGIFKTAMAGEGITDGYCLSVPYSGYFGTNEIINSFGSGAPFYLGSDNKTVHFGAEEEGFRSYVEMLADWYAKGYVDTKFSEHTTDIFYNIDATKVRNGKVGLFYGLEGTLGSQLDISDGKENNSTNGYTNGICVYGAPQPINDKYGDVAMQNITPFSFYRPGLSNLSVVISNKARDKDLTSLFTMFDYMFSEEGTPLNAFGLSKAQYEESQDPFYTSQGLTEGAYKWVDSSGNDWVEGTSTGEKYGEYNQLIESSSDLSGAVRNLRSIGRQYGPAKTYNAHTKIVKDGIGIWNKFDTNFNLAYYLFHSLSGENASSYSTALTNANTFLQQRLPSFIQGSKKATDDTTWTSFVTAIKKYKTDNVKQMLQSVMDAM
jgi:ABC-type glycerol-3-phosphate transport system substrate-binding protein